MRPQFVPSGWLPGAHGESGNRSTFSLAMGLAAQKRGSAVKLPPASVPHNALPPPLPKKSLHDQLPVPVHAAPVEPATMTRVIVAAPSAAMPAAFPTNVQASMRPAAVMWTAADPELPRNTHPCRVAFVARTALPSSA